MRIHRSVTLGCVHRLRPHRGGFSLFEVLIALALAMMLLSALFVFYFNLLDTRTRLLDATAQQRCADILIDRLETDVACCIVGDAQLGAGVRGSAEDLRLLTRSVAAHRAGKGTGDIGLFNDLQEVRFEFNRGARSVSLGRRAATESSSELIPLRGSIARVRFRFHDGGGWVDSFDSQSAGALPRAIEVAIWFDPWPGSEDEDGGIEGFEDDEAGFDDFEFGDLESFEGDEDSYFAAGDPMEPLPDRLRIIVIPDSDPGDEEDVEFSTSPDAFAIRGGGSDDREVDG